MHNSAYYQSGYAFFVAEHSCLKEYAANLERNEFAEEQIEAIRTVLQKLTRIRITNPTDAEDLVQETLLTMLTKCPNDELQKGLLVWTLGILRKKVGNYYRKTQRFTCFSDQDPSAQESIRGLAAAHSPESRVFHNELQTLIHQTLDQFPATQRLAMELLISGLSSGEIAKQLNTEPYQNVINHIYRGRRKLAKALARYGYGPDAKSGMRGMKRCRK